MNWRRWSGRSRTSPACRCRARRRALADGGPRKRAPKLPKLVKDSDEYKEIGRNVQTILAKEPTGLNGKQIADALGYPADERAQPHQGTVERWPTVPEDRAGGFDEVLFAVKTDELKRDTATPDSRRGAL